MANLDTQGPSAGGAENDPFQDFSVHDPFSEALPTAPATTALNSTINNNKRTAATSGLGIDEEVVVKKIARAPVPKFDEARLLSDKGLPELRRRAEILLYGDIGEGLIRPAPEGEKRGNGKGKLRGKGHEFGDVNRLLEMYQLWLHDVFPKAKFKDAIHMVEKLGHKRILQAERGNLLEERKMAEIRAREGAEWDGGVNLERGDDIFAEPTLEGLMSEQAARIVTGKESRERRERSEDVPDDLGMTDLFSRPSTLIPTRPAPRQTAGKSNTQLGSMFDDVPDEDDLDAFLASRDVEMEMLDASSQSQTQVQNSNIFGPRKTNPVVRQSGSIFGPKTGNVAAVVQKVEVVDDDDMDALMAELEAEKDSRQKKQEQPKPPKKAIMAEDHEDDMDGLMAEFEAEQSTVPKPQPKPQPKPAETPKSMVIEDDDDDMGELDKLMAENDAADERDRRGKEKEEAEMAGTIAEMEAEAADEELQERRRKAQEEDAEK